MVSTNPFERYSRLQITLSRDPLFQVVSGLTFFLVHPTAPPRFTKKPPSFIVIKEGGNVSFSFSTSGNPAPKITWSMQGRRESPARFRILDDKFEMDNVRFEDEGLITCHAENMFGVEVSKLNLTVLGESVVYLKTWHITSR